MNTPLSECGSRWVVDAADNYAVEIEPGEFLVLSFGQDARKPAAKFQHPNVAGVEQALHEFKHYHPSGRKWWTMRPGVNFYFVIPRRAIELVPEKGYSYIPAVINGVKVKFNVSGGTGGRHGGWTDWLHTRASCSVGHSIRDMKRIAAVAVRNSPLEPIAIEVLSPEDKKRFDERLAVSTTHGQVLQAFNSNQPVSLYLTPGWQFYGEDIDGGLVTDISCFRRLFRRKPTPEEHAANPEATSFLNYGLSQRIKSFVIKNAKGFMRVTSDQVDWAKTRERLSIPQARTG